MTSRSIVGVGFDGVEEVCSVIVPTVVSVLSSVFGSAILLVTLAVLEIDVPLVPITVPLTVKVYDAPLSKYIERVIVGAHATASSEVLVHVNHSGNVSVRVLVAASGPLLVIVMVYDTLAQLTAVVNHALVSERSADGT